MALVTIDVTQDDIERGVRNNCLSCPIALATERALSIVDAASVRSCMTTLYLRGCDPLPLVHVTTPMPARVFMDRFDNGYRVSPISFDLEIPDELLLTPSRTPAPTA